MNALEELFAEKPHKTISFSAPASVIDRATEACKALGIQRGDWIAAVVKVALADLEARKAAKEAGNVE